MLSYKTTVVGWYKHATVYRHYQEAVFAPEDIQYYNAIAKSSDCVLLPTGTRARKVQWEVPRKSSGWAYGFGRANVWYASEEDSRLQDYLTRLEKQINEYDGENWTFLDLIPVGSKTQSDDLAIAL